MFSLVVLVFKLYVYFYNPGNCTCVLCKLELQQLKNKCHIPGLFTHTWSIKLILNDKQPADRLFTLSTVTS